MGPAVTTDIPFRYYNCSSDAAKGALLHGGWEPAVEQEIEAAALTSRSLGPT